MGNQQLNLEQREVQRLSRKRVGYKHNRSGEYFLLTVRNNDIVSTSAERQRNSVANCCKIKKVDGYQKVAKVYDSLMKAGKFTAAQNKSEQGEYIDSISEFVALCEKDGFIPRYYTDGPQDKVDRVIEDMKQYTKTLVTEEMGLGNLIENAIKRLEDSTQTTNSSDDTAIDIEAEEQKTEEDKLFNYDTVPVVTDNDFKEFFNWEEEQEQLTDEELQKFIEEG